MPAKILTIIRDVILSFVFFIVAAIVINWVAGMIFGTKSNGDADFNGNILLAITVAATLLFYKYGIIRKTEK